MSTSQRPDALPPPDLREHGGIKDGQRQALDRRLFMQLVALDGCTDPQPLVEALEALETPAVLYGDANQPRGVAVLAAHEDPLFFVGAWRDLLNAPPFATLVPRPELSMLGRTYALGYEPDLEDALIQRPLRYVLDPDVPWAIWYPLRRSGAFANEPEEAQRAMLREHGRIGMAFGRAGLARDIRLACFGLHQADNDFVIGLLGAELHALSRVVQEMRATQQTSQYMDSLGPFFVGHVLWQAQAPALGEQRES